MATITITQAVLFKPGPGAPIMRGGPESPNVKETASQTYAQGAPVKKDSNGTIAVATATSNTVRNIAGFASAAATGTTGASVYYRPIRIGDQYIVNVKGTSTTTTAQTQVGAVTNFDLHTGNLLVANVDSTTDTYLTGRIISLYDTASGFRDGDTVGDTYGRVIVEILDSVALQG